MTSACPSPTHRERRPIPFRSFTWLLIPEKFSDAAKRDAIKGFVSWMLTDGQNDAEALSYAKLPKEVVAKEKQALARVQ